jgi:ADP-ribosylglycohydrolase
MTTNSQTTPTTQSRYRGALLGLATGDALGTTVEFSAPGSFEPVTDMVGGGPFNLPAGAWTDDTSMALCLGESLVTCGHFKPQDQLQRYVLWYREGYLSSTGKFFDIGGATRAALHRFEETGEAYPGDHAPTAAGNGPLMKLAPVPMAYAQHPWAAVSWSGLSCLTTHGDLEAVSATKYFAALLVAALSGDDVLAMLREGSTGQLTTMRAGLTGMLTSQDVVETMFGDTPMDLTSLSASFELDPKVAAIAAGSYITKQPPEIRGTGYIIDALEAALWALANHDTFEQGVLAAVNLGDDADTAAAIYGQLAGAIYGADAIPERWLEKLVMRTEITKMADDLLALAETVADPDGPVAWRRGSYEDDLHSPPSKITGEILTADGQPTALTDEQIAFITWLQRPRPERPTGASPPENEVLVIAATCQFEGMPVPSDEEIEALLRELRKTDE